MIGIFMGCWVRVRVHLEHINSSFCVSSPLCSDQLPLDVEVDVENHDITSCFSEAHGKGCDEDLATHHAQQYGNRFADGGEEGE